MVDWLVRQLLRWLQRGRYKDPRKRKELRIRFDLPYWRLDYYDDEESHSWKFITLSRERHKLVEQINIYRQMEQQAIEYFD